MKQKTIFLLVCCVLCNISSFAQRQKETINFCAEFEVNFMGDYTYQFIRQENGENLKDGPFDMKASINLQNLPYKHKVPWISLPLVQNYTAFFPSHIILICEPFVLIMFVFMS